VIPFFSWGLLLVADFAGALAALASMIVFYFLLFLVPVAHDLCGMAVGRVNGQESGGAFRSGTVTGSGRGIGVAVSGRGVIFLMVLTASVRASLCSLSESMAVLSSLWIL